MPNTPHAQTPSSRTRKGFAVIAGTVSPGHTSDGFNKCSQISRKVCDMMRHWGRGKHTQVTPHSRQRRWSADFCECETPQVIIVRKSKKEPQPPRRDLSLLGPHTASQASLKRRSCPPVGIFSSPSQSASSSSSSSCSSPPPVPTSVITGRDPLGWKLGPRSSTCSLRARAHRLSLQIPLPVVSPDLKPSPVPKSPSGDATNPVTSHKTNPAPRPKPSRRCNSDSSAFLGSLVGPAAPVVTLEELCAVHLRPVDLQGECDDVFVDGNEGQGKPRKIPPPIPNKTLMARQAAQLIARSRQGCKPAASKTEEDVYTTAIKPHWPADHNSKHARKSGLRLDSSCDRQRLSPRFPGREI